MSPILQLAAMGGFGGGRQQGLTAKDVVELQQTMNQIYQQAGRGDSDITRQLTMKLLTETLPSWQNQATQNMQLAYQTQIQALKDQISDPIKDMKYISEAAKMMGMGPSTQDKEVALARMQMEDRWKVEEFKFRREELNTQKLLGTVKQILENVNLPEMVRAATREKVGEQFRAQQPPPPQAPPPGPALPQGSDQLVKYECLKCKGADGHPTEIWAPSSQVQVTCQGCGSVFTVKPGSVRQQ